MLFHCSVSRRTLFSEPIIRYGIFFLTWKWSKQKRMNYTLAVSIICSIGYHQETIVIWIIHLLLWSWGSGVGLCSLNAGRSRGLSLQGIISHNRFIDRMDDLFYAGGIWELLRHQVFSLCNLLKTCFTMFLFSSIYSKLLLKTSVKIHRPSDLPVKCIFHFATILPLTASQWQSCRLETSR